jgi:hypothetical protein
LARNNKRLLLRWVRSTRPLPDRIVATGAQAPVYFGKFVPVESSL